MLRLQTPAGMYDAFDFDVVHSTESTMKKLIVTLSICLWVISALHPPLATSAEDRQTLRERIRERRATKSEPSTRNASISQPGTYKRRLVHDGLHREYLVHVPEGYDPSKPAPLVIALHGGGGSMEIQSNDTNYGLITKSNESGVIVAFPNGYSRRRSGSLATWNAGECCGARNGRTSTTWALSARCS